MNPADIARQVILLDNYENFDIDDYVSVLQAADDLYFNGQESFVSDEEYDALRKYAHQLEPHHSYFTGVGAEVRGGKVKLPYPMGSLDQVDIGEITEWVRNWDLQQETLVVTDKLDGTSALVVYDKKGMLQIAYSRGDGTHGADITRHIKQIVPAKIKSTTSVAIRGEIIIRKNDFPKVQQLVKTRSGTQYKNLRNCVAGLMNAEQNNPEVYQYLNFVAYDIIHSTQPKALTFLQLTSYNFDVPEVTTRKGVELTDHALSEYLSERRFQSHFEIDGLVIDVNNPQKRKQMTPTRDTLNPAYAIKYKVADENNVAVTTVTNVEWRVSKHGYLKPRINIDPVNLVGVTIANCTGFNAKFIYDNGIGKGAEIQVVRAGDVIPFCQKVIKSVVPQLPSTDLNWDWNETGVDIILTDTSSHEDVMIRQVTDFFATIDVPNLKEGVVRQMFQQNKYNSTLHALQLMVNYDEDHWFSCIGVNGRKIYNGIRQKLNNIPLYLLMGATPFFGRGVGVRKMKKLQQALGTEHLLCVDRWEEIDDVEGFDEKTAKKVISGYQMFDQLLGTVTSVGSIAKDVGSSGGAMKNQKVVFTGFRDKELAALVESEGGEMQSAVSGKTTILVASNPNSNSGKMKKARDLGILVYGIDQFKDFLS